MGKVVVQGYVIDPIGAVCNEDIAGDVILRDYPYKPFGLFGTVRDKILNEQGVRNYADTKRYIGHYIDIIDRCNIRIYYMNQKCTLEQAQNSIATIFDGRYYEEIYSRGYSEFTITGYKLDNCTIGGHDLVKEVRSHLKQYVIFVLEW